MKIHVNDGTVEFATGSIGPAVDRNAFLQSSVAGKQSYVNGPFALYAIQTEAGIGATAQFYGDRLEVIFVWFSMPDDSDDNWNEAHERLRMKVHDEWLQIELGEPPYRFAWGRIESVFDAKGCEGEIHVSYGEPRTSSSWRDRKKS